MIRVRLYRSDTRQYLDVTHVKAGDREAWLSQDQYLGNEFVTVLRRNCLLDVGEISWTIGNDLCRPEAGTVNVTLANDPASGSFPDKGIFGNMGNLGFFDGVTLRTVIICLIDADSTKYLNLPLADLDPTRDETYNDITSLRHGAEDAIRFLPRFCGFIDPQSITYKPAIHRINDDDQIVRSVSFQCYGLEKLVARFLATGVFDPVTNVPYDNIPAAGEYEGEFDGMPAGYAPPETDHTRTTPIHHTMLPPVIEEMFAQLQPYLPPGMLFRYEIELDETSIVGLHIQLLPDSQFEDAYSDITAFTAFYVRQAGESKWMTNSPTAIAANANGFTAQHLAAGWNVIHDGEDGTVENLARRLKYVNAGFTTLAAAMTSGPPPVYSPDSIVYTVGLGLYVFNSHTYGWSTTDKYRFSQVLSGTSPILGRSTWSGTAWTSHAFPAGSTPFSTNTYETPEEMARKSRIIYDSNDNNILVIQRSTVDESLGIYIKRVSPTTAADVSVCLNYNGAPFELDGPESIYLKSIRSCVIIRPDGSMIFFYAPTGGSWPATNYYVWNFSPYLIIDGVQTNYQILPGSVLYVPTLGGRAHYLSALVRDGSKVRLWTCPLQDETDDAIGFTLMDNMQMFYPVSENYEDGQTYDLDYSPESLGTGTAGVIYGFVNATPFRLGPEAGYIIRNADLSDEKANLMEPLRDLAFITQSYGTLEYSAYGGQSIIRYRHRQFDWSGLPDPIPLDGPLPTYPPEFTLLLGKPGDMPFQPISKYCTDGVEVTYEGGKERPRANDSIFDPTQTSGISAELGDFDHAIQPLSLSTPWTWSRTLAAHYARRYYERFVNCMGWQVRTVLAKFHLLDLVTLAGRTWQIVGIKEAILKGSVSLELISHVPKDPAADCVDRLWGEAVSWFTDHYATSNWSDRLSESNLTCIDSCAAQWEPIFRNMNAQTPNFPPWVRNAAINSLLIELSECVNSNCSCGGSSPGQIS